MRHTIEGVVLVLAGALATAAAQAAPLNLAVAYPDLTTSGATLSHSFDAQCFASGTTAGPTQACGTTSGKGKNKITYDVLDTASSSGVLTVTGSSMIIQQDSSGGFSFITGGSYSLTANFTGAGLFDPTGSTVSATGVAMTTSSPYDAYQSGTLVTGDLSAFGFSGNGSAGVLEFEFTNVGGDMAAFGSLGGVIIGISGVSPSWGGDWDTLATDGTGFWQHSFTASTVTVDTFVPVPAAVWLFGSGLLALSGLARRRS